MAQEESVELAWWTVGIPAKAGIGTATRRHFALTRPSSTARLAAETSISLSVVVRSA